jgi:antirestriction protein
MSNEEKPRIYVACLAAYNAGRLHGDWIDCDRDESEIWEDIETMLESSPETDAEDWAIHAFENWHGIGIGEHEPIARIAELGQAIAKHGEAIALFYGEKHELEGFEDSYRGKYENEETFVRERLEEDGTIEKIEKIGLQDFYLDLEAIARDWFIGRYFSEKSSDHSIHVFSC